MRSYTITRSLVSASWLVSTALALGLLGCKSAPVVPPAPPVLRPEAQTPTQPDTAARTDCDVPSGDAESPMTYEQRKPRIQEAQALAQQGTAQLNDADEQNGLDPKSREESLTEAVSTFIAALGADPYNVQATYNLAAAYARIGRPQCALTLLDRLVQMNSHPSRQADVGEKLDRLLGRSGVALDRDFRDLRQNPVFACIISNIGASKPKNCFADS